MSLIYHPCAKTEAPGAHRFGIGRTGRVDLNCRPSHVPPSRTAVVLFRPVPRGLPGTNVAGFPTGCTGRSTRTRRSPGWPSRRFGLDRAPVTRGDFLAFVTAQPGWRRSQVKRVFADADYLRDWADDLDPGEGEATCRWSM